MEFQYEGLIIAIATFLMIGLFHPIVIKGEYHFGTKIWPIFLIIGLALTIASLFIKENLLNAMTAIAGTMFLWSIIELFEQRARVKKGWYPKKEKNSEAKKP